MRKNEENLETQNDSTRASGSAKWRKRIAFWLLPITVAVFIAALIGIMVLLDEGSDADVSMDNFYKSERFNNIVDNWMENLESYLIQSDFISKEGDTSYTDDTKLYELAEYADVLNAVSEKEQTAKKTKTNADATKPETAFDSVTFGYWKDAGESVAKDISLGTDNGSQYFLFYDELKETVNNQIAFQTGGERERSFLHLTGTQYHALLEQYLMSRNELLAAGIQLGHYENEDQESVEPDDANPEEDTWVAEYNYMYTTSDDTSISDFFNDTQCRGIVNIDTGNWLVYDTVSLNVVSSGTLYSWSLQDVSADEDFYFPADLLDYSSPDQLAVSILTTPFTTIENSMAYLSQILMDDDSEENYYSVETLNQFDFSVEYENEYDSGATCNTDEMKNERYVITYDVAKKTYDAATEKLIANGTLTYDFAKRLSQMNGVQKVTIGIPKGISTDSYGKGLVITWCQAYEYQVYAMACVSGLLSLILFLYLIVAQPAVCYRRDRFKLLMRTAFYGVLAVVLVALLTIYLDFVFRAIRYDSALQLLFFVIVGAVPYLMLYGVLMDYVLGIVRHVKAGDFLDNCLIVCIYRKCRVSLNGSLKRFRDKTKRFAEDVCAHISIAKRSVLYIICYFAGNVIWLLLTVALIDLESILVVPWIALGMFANVRVLCYVYRDMRAMDTIIDGITKIVEGDLSFQIDTADMKGHKQTLAQLVNRIGEGLDKAVEQSTRDERLKAELITNVSHDIKTPLTSIINYVDLVKREGVTEEPLKGYIEVLDAKSMRLKQLIEDLVEASKASTGNLELTPVNLNMAELVSQTIGEFEDKFQDKNLELVTQIEDYALTVYADGRRCYRIVENLFQNIYKYAMPHTRVYLNMNHVNGNVELILRNISEAPLKVDVEELTQRFVRGEESRTTEGSGLGLSIAKSLTQLQGGQFDITLDGDLFKVIVTFPLAKGEKPAEPIGK